MASAEHEPITGVWSGAPSGVQGRAPSQGVGKAHLKLKVFSCRDTLVNQSINRLLRQKAAQ